MANEQVSKGLRIADIGEVKFPFLMALASTVVVAVVMLLLPRYYRSEARILPVESRPSMGIGQLASAAAALGVAIPGQESNDLNFVDIVGSRYIRERLLLREYSYAVCRWRFGNPTQKRENLLSYLGTKNIDIANIKLGSIISVLRDPKTRLITIAVETTSPTLSQEICSQVITELDTFLQEKGRTRGSVKASFAESRLKEARNDSGKAQEILRQFLDRNRNYQTSADPGIRLEGTRLESEYRLSQQILGTLAVNREQSLLEEKNDMPILNILDSSNCPLISSRPNLRLVVIFTFIFSFFGCWLFRNRAILTSRWEL